MIKFEKQDADLFLIYSSDSSFHGNWASQALNREGWIELKRTFYLEKHNFISSDNEELETLKFLVGNLVGEYYLLDKEVLSISFDLYIHKSVKLEHKSFVAERNIPIFQELDKLHPGKVYIGGNHPNRLPENKFEELVKSFPNHYELKRYVSSRVSSAWRDYVDTKIDGEQLYNQYMKKKVKTKKSGLSTMFNADDLEKYILLLKKLEEMLSNQDGYSESQWQEDISQFILLLYPKYIRVFKESPVRDANNAKRRIDLLLVDSDGNVDIIEIKKPSENCIVTEGLYRKNHIPLRDLSGTIMQIEKYIFWLNKSGRSGEEELNKEYQDKLPKGLKIKVTNPSGIIIMGRSSKLSPEQKDDFEIIRRKYKNVVDVITYDDLLKRLKVTIEHFRENLN